MMPKIKLIPLLILYLSFFSCSKFETKDEKLPSIPTESDPGPTPSEGGSVVLHWFGPDYPEDFDKFGGITGYYIHWSTSPVSSSTTSTCGNLLDLYGRPDDKYSFRIQVLGTSPECRPRSADRNSLGSHRNKVITYAHECTYKVKGLPQDIPLYFAINPFIGDPNHISAQWWGCSANEFTLTVPSKF